MVVAYQCSVFRLAHTHAVCLAFYFDELGIFFLNIIVRFFLNVAFFLGCTPEEL